LIGEWASGSIANFFKFMEEEIPVLVYTYEMAADYKA